MTEGRDAATVIIPAHDEEAVLPRLLDALTGDDRIRLRIIVACNGCTDRTAEIAREAGERVEVVELAEPSKGAAIAHAGAMVTDFPVLFVDADVLISGSDVEAIVRALEVPGIEAAAPTRSLERTGVTRPAAYYYDVWERLPQVRTGLFGRGVIALTEAGYRRVSGLPRYIADDAAFSESFAPDERTVVADARVTVWPARTWRALVARRVRAIEGMRELRSSGLSPAASATSLGDLGRIAAHEPSMILRLPFFVITTAAARSAERRRRRAGRTDWVRDESSRVS